MNYPASEDSPVQRWKLIVFTVWDCFNTGQWVHFTALHSSAATVFPPRFIPIGCVMDIWHSWETNKRWPRMSSTGNSLLPGSVLDIKWKYIWWRQLAATHHNWSKGNATRVIECFTYWENTLVLFLDESLMRRSIPLSCALWTWS